jgi:predicted nucleotidyltransferase
MRTALKPGSPIRDFGQLRPQVTETLLAEITRRIVDAFHPQKVILFGSYAYGQPDESSDVDLLVIMDSPETPLQRIRRVAEVAEERFLPMDILVYTPSDIAARQAMGDPFIHGILTQGRELYARDACG